VNLVDLHVLRRVSEMERPTMEAIISDCAHVTSVDGRVLILARKGMLTISRRGEVEHLKPTAAGLAALEAEPKRHRDQPGLTNR
jgi:hypothetical protein